MGVRVAEKTESSLNYKAPVSVKTVSAIGALVGSGAYIMILAKRKTGKNILQNS